MSPPPPPGVNPDAQTYPTGDLFQALYAELRRTATAHLSQERPGHTLSPTALVNEVYLRFARRQTGWTDRAHFLRSAARAMRNILISHARSKARLKRGGDRSRVDLGALDLASPPADENLIALDEALTALAGLDPRAADVVELRYFGDVAWAELAGALDMSETAAKQNWAFAKAWLFKHLDAGAGHRAD